MQSRRGAESPDGAPTRERRSVLPVGAFTPAPPRAAGRDAVPPTSGMAHLSAHTPPGRAARRPGTADLRPVLPVGAGTARERETNADDAAPYQRERCTRSQPRPRSPCRGSVLSMTGGGCNRTRSSAFLPVGVRPAIHPGPTAGIGPSRALSAGRLASTGRTGQPRRLPGFHHRLSRPDRICRARVL